MGSKFKLNNPQTATVGGAEWTIVRIKPFAGEMDECDWFRCARNGSNVGVLHKQSKLCRGMFTVQQIAERVERFWAKYTRGRNGEA